MMLSESQERMLMVIKPERKDLTFKIFNKWGLQAKEIGKITKSGKMEIFFNKKLAGCLPIKPLADSSPEYDRPSKKTKKIKIRDKGLRKNLNCKEALLKILSGPNHSSKKWLYSQYDSSVMCDTIYSSEDSLGNPIYAIGEEPDPGVVWDQTGRVLGSFVALESDETYRIGGHC